jgi:MFS family permease
MVDIVAISILIVGVLIGATVSGVIAHTINYIFTVDEGYHWAILFGYILVLTIGMTIEYGHPLIIAVTSFLGIVIIAGRIFDQLKDRLPHKITIRQE